MMGFRFDHAMPFVECTIYTAAIYYNGTPMPGPVPNPWSFKSVCPPLVLLYATPGGGTAGVPIDEPIVITFSKPVNPSTFTITLLPPVGNLTPHWSIDLTTVTVTHDPFAPCTTYSVWVTVNDLDGNPLQPGPWPNPWSFTTECTLSLGCLQVHRVFPDDVLLTWCAVPGQVSYNVFHSNDRLAQWPWPIIANASADSVLIRGHLSDQKDHFYIVRAFAGLDESANSTMGVLRNIQVTPNPNDSNIMWLSLPYNTIYKRASDIVGELGTGKIDVVGKWDAVKQKIVHYLYFKGRWQGTNFPIVQGEGLWIGVLSAFTWPVNGTDKSFSLQFDYRPSLKTHLYWIGLPYTGPISKASEMVLAIEGGLGPGTNTKIAQIGKWDFATQTSLVYMYRATGWGGNDFAIDSGDGIWITVTSSFAWSPELITPEVV